MIFTNIKYTLIKHITAINWEIPYNGLTFL